MQLDLFQPKKAKTLPIEVELALIIFKGAKIMSFIDLTNVETNEWSPLEPGWYEANIQDAIVSENKAGTGRYLKVTYKLKDSGRTVYDYFNFDHEKDTVQRIGLGQMKRMFKAANLPMAIDDPQDICGATLQVKVAVETRDDRVSNSVKGYKAAEESSDVPF